MHFSGIRYEHLRHSIPVFTRRQAHTCMVSQLYPSHRGHDLAARSLNIGYIAAETPAATIALLLTPWPIVLGQAVVSIVLMAIELKTMGTGSVSIAKWAVLYTFNMIRGLGAVVWMVEDIKAGEKMPSIGVVLIMLALCISCIALPTTQTAFPHALSFIGHAVCFVGLGLYTASGILSVVHNGFQGYSIIVVVTMGCPGGLQYPDSIFDNRPLYCAALQPNYEFKAAPGFGVWLGFLWTMGLVVVLIFFLLWTLAFLLWCTHPCRVLSHFMSSSNRSSADHRDLKRPAIRFAMMLTSIGGILAAGAAAATMTGGIQESFLDCRNAQQQSYGSTNCNQTSISLPASPSGYFTTWSKYWEAIVRSMFVW
jgi:hypothetical protein